jgi:hypothetical protein
MTHFVSLRARILAPALARLSADESNKSTSTSKKIFSPTIGPENGRESVFIESNTKEE